MKANIFSAPSSSLFRNLVDTILWLISINHLSDRSQTQLNWPVFGLGAFEADHFAVCYLPNLKIKLQKDGTSRACAKKSLSATHPQPYTGSIASCWVCVVPLGNPGERLARSNLPFESPYVGQSIIPRAFARASCQPGFKVKKSIPTNCFLGVRVAAHTQKIVNSRRWKITHQ